jgi:predicted dithiol-disulfide oxidoreductase (DUF899 family)
MPTAELTRDEIVAEMDRVSQQRRHLPAANVLQAYWAGTLEDAGELADVLVLATLLPDDDPLFTRS